jgi:hypothetical protein
MRRHTLASILFINILFFCICFGLFWFGTGWISSAAAQSAQVPSNIGCVPEGSPHAASLDIGEDGVILLDGKHRLRLAGLLWPDGQESETRKALARKIITALAGQKLSWRPAGEADRWGITPAHVFVAEPDGLLPPFWLQGGIVEAGLAPAWPDLIEKPCWIILQLHETIARRAKRGFWAPRAQAARHSRIRQDPAQHQGRRIVALWRVSSVKSGRAVTFVNLGKPARSGASLWISQSQRQNFSKAGREITQWTGKWIITRFVLNEYGLRRIRIETPDHVDILDERPHADPAQNRDEPDMPKKIGTP